MLLVEEQAVFTPEDPGAGGSTNEVSDGVSADRSNEEDRRQQGYV
jgi:hypothetical protein